MVGVTVAPSATVMFGMALILLMVAGLLGLLALTLFARRDEPSARLIELINTLRTSESSDDYSRLASQDSQGKKALP